MHGLIVMHHLVSDVPAETLRDGLVLLGAALTPTALTPTAVLTTAFQEATG